MSDKNGHDSPQTNGLKVPKHVAIIADGNGRWAKRRHLPRLAGHRAGVENMRRVLEALVSQGVEYVTLYAFSTENWRRPEHEVRGLMRILREAIDRETRALHEKDIRLVHVGRVTRLSSGLQKAVEHAQELTRNNTKATLCIAFDYGGRSEIIQAVKRLLAEGVSPDDVDEEMFGGYLYTAGIPDPDLVIRTGDEQRLSNFLLWQTHYSEYFFTPTLWPDFNGVEVDKALQAYNQRMRRYGSLKVEA